MQKLSSVQKITLIPTIANKKIKSAVCIISVLYSISVWFELIVTSASFYFLLESTKEEKIEPGKIKCKLDGSSKMWSGFLGAKDI